MRDNRFLSTYQWEITDFLGDFTPGCDLIWVYGGSPRGWLTQTSVGRCDHPPSQGHSKITEHPPVWQLSLSEIKYYNWNNAFKNDRIKHVLVCSCRPSGPKIRNTCKTNIIIICTFIEYKYQYKGASVQIFAYKIKIWCLWMWNVTISDQI